MNNHNKIKSILRRPHQSKNPKKRRGKSYKRHQLNKEKEMTNQKK
jgi:hypothetical protein